MTDSESLCLQGMGIVSHCSPKNDGCWHCWGLHFPLHSLNWLHQHLGQSLAGSLKRLGIGIQQHMDIDIVGALANAARSKTPSIHFGLYFSQLEWFNPLYLQDQTKLKRTFVKSHSINSMR